MLRGGRFHFSTPLPDRKERAPLCSVLRQWQKRWDSVMSRLAPSGWTIVRLHNMQPRLFVLSPLLIIVLFMWIAACLRIGASSTGPTKSALPESTFAYSQRSQIGMYSNAERTLSWPSGDAIARMPCSNRRIWRRTVWDNGSFHAGAGEIRGIQIITSATSPSYEPSRDSP
jgi:hypothetical protein